MSKPTSNLKVGLPREKERTSNLEVGLAKGKKKEKQNKQSRQRYEDRKIRKLERQKEKQARTYVDPRGLNMNCNVLDALGLNFRTDFVTCEDCPTCSTCLTWMTFLSVEKFSKSGAMAS